MASLRIFVFILSIVTFVLASGMYVCICVDISHYEYNTNFVITAVFTTILSMIFYMSSKILNLKVAIINNNQSVSNTSLTIFIVLLWVITIVIAMVPFITYDVSIVNAIFESTSGITTTGATIFYNLDYMPKGLLLWRMLLHFFGCIGINLTSLAVTCILNIRSSNNILFTKDIVPDANMLIKYHLKPDYKHITKDVLSIFTILGIACAVLYFIGGMNMFDAISHSISTISTGGFANYDASFAHFNSFFIEIVSSIFIILSSLPIFFFLTLKRTHCVFWSEQITFFIITLTLLILITTVILHFENIHSSLLECFRYSLFTCVNIASTTGFTNINYADWNAGNILIMLFFIMFIGGCLGSTTGGIKTWRILILMKSILNIDQKKHQIRFIKIDNHAITDRQTNNINLFINFYIIIAIICIIIFSILGLDIRTSFSIAAATLTNTGPGFGKISPNYNYNELSSAVKYFSCTVMLLGRLEIIPFLVILNQVFFNIKKIYRRISNP
ncbi:MAG: cation transport family protein [Candidatus Xenolissoclinum pacificiensis L6]|uniref:Cation transport family protein n=1 Tax=Candidatus Xenolissoclinum pacificiensis L6 TaxID=1401685 RepID=W2UYV8_9RICK|nr:MAG: cation transport family protein [Candidatus Xenolissoclinum pacificiensis L6]